LEREMQRLNAVAFYQAGSRIREFWGRLELLKNQEGSNLGPDKKIDYLLARTFVTDIEPILSELRTLGAAVTAPPVERLIASLKKQGEKAGGHFTYGNLRDALGHIHETLRDELGQCHVFVLESRYAKYYEVAESLFGKGVAERFPSAAFEVDEAGKCLALGRSTASVFHLMRVLEIGIKAMARSLGISDPINPAERNWGVILRKLRVGIDEKWPRQVDRASGDGHLFDSLYASLDAVKNPWRNSAVHVESKYTPDEAEHILGMVKGFMAKLASRIDESGQPPA
jgi:hypothetical protein